MARPKLKAQERYTELLKMIDSTEVLDPFTFRTILREHGNDASPLAQIVIALAHIAAGDIDTGLGYLESYLIHDDAKLANIYCHMLLKHTKLDKLDEHIYTLADKYPSKWFNFKAGAIAYLMGRVSICEKYLSKHVKMLSEDEDRSSVEMFVRETIKDMSEAYEISGCSAQQYKALTLVIGKIIFIHNSPLFKSSITGACGGSHIVEVSGVSPSEVAEMNMLLADEVCKLEVLDDCNLIARFSVERPNSRGLNYAY